MSSKAKEVGRKKAKSGAENREIGFERKLAGIWALTGLLDPIHPQ